MRKTGVLNDKDRMREAWITIGDPENSGAVISTNARLGNNFRVRLTEDVTLEPPYEPMDGQRVAWRIEQDSTGGRVLTLNSAKFLVRGALFLSTVANSVSLLEAQYDNETGLWDAWGIPDLSSVYEPAIVAQGAIPDASGGVVVDIECRVAVNTLLAELRSLGFISP